MSWTCAPDNSALNIILNFEDTLSSSPSFDTFTGTTAPSGLQSLFQYAETFYQDVFETSHTLTINYWYTDLDDNTLGLHSLVSESGGRENEANIRIDTTTSGGATRNWFIDPTPSTDTEFNMGQTLWRDLSSTQQTDWYNWSGTALDTFEVGYTGTAIAGTDAQGVTDMLSVVLHEVGHALGMSASNDSTVAETNDGDYDYDSVNILGATLAVETANDSGDDNDNIAHIENSNALMTPSIGTSRRRLPSHTDLLAMAAVHDYTALDIPRREFYGDSIGDGVGSWNTSAHWTGNTVPGTGDEVFVRDAQPGQTMTAFLTANGFASELHISEGANVDTGAFKLDVGGDVTVTGLDTDVIIDPDGELEADEVFIQDQAEVAMGGGTLDVRRVVIDDGTQIRSYAAGSATVQVSQALVNNGSLTSTGDSLLYFSTTTPTPWDLDGTSGDGTINASSGRVWFDTGSMSDAFSSEVTVGAGQFFRFDAPWTLDGNGVIDLNGGTVSEPARIIGGVLTATGSAEIQATGQTSFDNAVDFGPSVTIETGAGASNLEFQATADLDGTDFTLRTGALIEFNGTTNLSGTTSVNTISNVNSTVQPSIDFDGQTFYNSYTLTKTGSPELTVQQNGDARFVGTNTINANIYDMDGTSGSVLLDFGDGINSGSLILNVDAVDTSGNTFNGTLDLTSLGFTGGLTVNLNNPTTRWTMAGTADMSGNVIAYINRISGTPFNSSGTFEVSSLVGINADLGLLSSAVVNFASTSSALGLRGDTSIFAGATFNGGGTIDVQSTGSLTFSNGADTGSSDLRNRGTLAIAGNGNADTNFFDQTDSGTWEVTLGGSASTSYDVLTYDGIADLDGIIDLALTGGYTPTLYSITHTVLDGILFASRTGIFDQVGGAVQSGFGLAVLYTGQDVQVRAALLGDANLSGQVEQADLDAVLQNWGQSNFAGGEVSWVTGDLNGSGQVEQGDLDLVLQNWGSTEAPDFKGFIVPEPTTATLVLLGVTAALGQPRRNDNRPA